MMKYFSDFMKENLDDVNESKKYDQKIKEVSTKIDKLTQELKNVYTKEVEPLWEELNSHESVLSVASEKSNLVLRKIYSNVFKALNELERK